MKLGYTIIYVENVIKTIEFYQKAFGLKQHFMHESGQYAECETGHTVLAFAQEDFVSSNGKVFKRNRLKDPAPAFEIAFLTNDVPAAFKKAIAVGATEVAKPQQMPWGQTVASVRDLNGIIVELCTPIE